tara:strand:+ start:1306 stop:2913 length:1608 start_codon:yes stop_codon:yes gene_type:complete
MKTATDPTTGKKVYWDGQQWLPLKTATNPQTGAQVGIVGGQTFPLSTPSTTPPALRGFEPEMAARETLREELEQFGPEVSRRFQNVTGDDPSLLEKLYRAPELALIGGSQAARAGGATLATYLSSWIPNAVKEGAEAAYDRIKDTEAFRLAAQAASLGDAGYQAFKERMPEAAERFESAVDVGLLFSPRPDIPRLDIAKRGAQKEATRLVRENKKDGVTLLLEPVTPEMRDVFEEKGVLRTKTWEPNEFDNLVIDTVTDMKGVKPNRSYTYNYRQVQKETDAAKQTTDKIIIAQNKAIDADRFLKDMQGAVDEVLKDPVVRIASGDIQKQLNELSEIVLESVQTSGSDLVGVLEVRRRFDDLINNFDGTPNAKSIAARKIRGVLNDTLKANTRGDKLHNLLTKQFHGITAMEDMLPKRNAEARDVVSRAVRNLQSVDLLPNTVLALSATGTTALGLTGGAIPALGAGTLGATTYLTIQTLKPRNQARIYASMLSAIDKAIPLTKGTALKELEMDRLLIVDLIDQTREDIKEEESE